MNIEQMKSQFLDPPAKFAFAPFWFLNHELTDEELKWQIQEMNANGVRGFILHPRHGLITEYLSEDYFDRIRTCIEEADKLGMKAYLYDENNWPSGPVDGVLLESYPQYRMSGCIISQRFHVAGGRSLKQKLDVRDGLIAAVAVPVEKNILVGLPQDAVLLDSFIKDGTLKWVAPDDVARWAVFIFARIILRGGTFFGGYLDTLNDDAVAKFIEMTHQKYAERFSKYFGGIIDGIFTDEPSMCYFGADTIPFTPSLPSEFCWRHNYDFWRVLPAIFENAGNSTAQMRCDFYNTITAMYQDAYFKQIYDYCDPLHLNTIGHVMQEGELYQSTRHQGDFFRGAEFMHFAGCDFLCDITWPSPGNGALNNLVGPKLASSAAHIFNKARAMSECFGLAGGWHVDMRLLKCLADWLVALGINFLQPHAFYYSIQGHRKWECPPGEFYQSPFWPYYKYLADYAARLCSIFTGAEHVADVAVIWPARSMWAAIDPTNTEESKKIIKSFETITSALLKAGYDFDIIPEETLTNEMSSLDLEHYPSGEQYQALVIPYCPTLMEDTANFISDCAEQGSNVVLAGDAPHNFIINSGAEWNGCDWSEAVFMELFRYAFDSGRHALMTRGVEDVGQSTVVIPNAMDMDENTFVSVFSELFDDLFDADVKVQDANSSRQFIPEIIHSHYMHGENDFYMFVNTSRDTTISALISLDTIGVPSIWNAETGAVNSLPSYDYDGERTTFKLEFQPCESYVISVTTMPIGEEVVEIEAEPKYGKVIELADEWEFDTEKPNALPLSDWRFTMEAHGGSASHVYTTEFDCAADLTIARIAIDGLLTEKIWRRTASIHTEITLNGGRINGFVQGEYLDHLIMEADVLPHIKQGKNILQIRCNTQLAAAGNLSDPAYFIGDFEVHDKGKKAAVVSASGCIRTGDWAVQGYAYYSGIGIYRQIITLSHTNKRVYLHMEKPGDMAELIVNGEFAAVLAWDPWVADITDLVKSGENEIIIRVANSMGNILMMTDKPSGILGKVEIAITK